MASRRTPSPTPARSRRALAVGPAVDQRGRHPPDQRLVHRSSGSHVAMPQIPHLVSGSESARGTARSRPRRSSDRRRVEVLQGAAADEYLVPDLDLQHAL